MVNKTAKLTYFIDIKNNTLAESFRYDICEVRNEFIEMVQNIW